MVWKASRNDDAYMTGLCAFRVNLVMHNVTLLLHSYSYHCIAVNICCQRSMSPVCPLLFGKTTVDQPSEPWLRLSRIQQQLLCVDRLPRGPAAAAAGDDTVS